MSWNIDTDYSFADFHIGSGDRVLWKGCPEKGVTLTSRELSTIPFGIIFSAFAIFWMSMVLASGAPEIMAIFGLPFVFIGLYLAGGRIIVNEIMKGKTAYVITDKAIIRKRGSRVDVWYGRDLSNMQVFTHKNGTTSFMFSTVHVHYSGRRGVSTRYFGIENVRDAKDVSEAIKQIDRN